MTSIDKPGVQRPARYPAVGGITRTIGIMRSSLTCPKCTSRKFWILDQLSLLRRVELAITGFEAMVCGRCGFTEIYAADLSRVARVGTFVDGDASG